MGPQQRGRVEAYCRRVDATGRWPAAARAAGRAVTVVTVLKYHMTRYKIMICTSSLTESHTFKMHWHHCDWHHDDFPTGSDRLARSRRVRVRRPDSIPAKKMSINQAKRMRTDKLCTGLGGGEPFQTLQNKIH